MAMACKWRGGSHGVEMADRERGRVAVFRVPPMMLILCF